MHVRESFTKSKVLKQIDRNVIPPNVVPQEAPVECGFQSSRAVAADSLRESPASCSPPWQLTHAF